MPFVALKSVLYCQAGRRRPFVLLSTRDERSDHTGRLGPPERWCWSWSWSGAGAGLELGKDFGCTWTQTIPDLSPRKENCRSGKMVI